MSWFTRLFKKEKPAPEAQLQLDFVHTFPHVVWISSIGHDEISPEGFCYKVLTLRREPEMLVDIVLLRQSVDGTKTRLAHMQGPLDGFDGAYDLVQDLAKGKSLTFERFDLTDVRTFDDFQARAIDIGWEAIRSE